MARHARLFELLRQENLALKMRSSPPAPKSADQQAAVKFRQTAERSLGGGPAVL
jgi:hypothetical protein